MSDNNNNEALIKAFEDLQTISKKKLDTKEASEELLYQLLETSQRGQLEIVDPKKLTQMLGLLHQTDQHILHTLNDMAQGLENDTGWKEMHKNRAGSKTVIELDFSAVREIKPNSEKSKESQLILNTIILLSDRTSDYMVTQAAEKDMFMKLKDTIGLGKLKSPQKSSPVLPSTKEVHFGSKKPEKELNISDANTLNNTKKPKKSGI